MSKKIQVGKWNIEVKDQLSWYDTKEIEATMIGGAKMGIENDVPKLTGIEGDILFKAKVKLFSLAILSVQEEGSEKSAPFSLDWLKTLTKNEGDVLDTTLDDLYKAEKKN